MPPSYFREYLTTSFKWGRILVPPMAERHEVHHREVPPPYSYTPTTLASIPPSSKLVVFPHTTTPSG